MLCDYAVCVLSYRQISEKNSTDDVEDDMNLNVIQDSFFCGTDTEQGRGKDSLDIILMNYRICRKNSW